MGYTSIYDAALDAAKSYLAPAAGTAAVGAYAAQKLRARKMAQRAKMGNQSNATRPNPNFKLSIKRKSGKAERAVARYVAGIGSYTYFNSYKKTSRFVQNLLNNLQKNAYYTNNHLRPSISAGVQNVFSVGITDTASVSTFNTAALSVPNANRFFLPNVEGKFYMTNQDQTMLHIEIYDCISKLDISSSSVGLPDSAWSAGLADEPGTTAGNVNFIGARPWQSDLFNQYYKVDKVSQVQVPPGGTHIHTIKIKDASPIHGARMEYSTKQLGGYSRSVMFVVHGMPDDDKTTHTAATVTTGTGVLNIVYKIDYEYTFNSDSTFSYYYSNNLPNSFAAGESVINVITGAAVQPPTGA